jgi:arylsulfatase A-like enzyme
VNPSAPVSQKRRVAACGRSGLGLAGRAFACVLATVALLLPGCRARESAPPQLEQRLLDKVFSEKRFEASWSLVDRVSLDFRDSLTLRNLYLPDLVVKTTPQGLEGSSSGGDPKIVLPYAERPWTEIEVELQSDADTFLQVYWAAEQEGFSDARSKKVEVRRSRAPVRYEVDLRHELAGVAGGLRLRIDPVAGKSQFTLLRIELARPSAAASGEGGPPLTGVKVRLGGDTREALVVSTGRPVEWPLSVPQRAYLAFGAAVQHAPPQGCVLRLSFRDRDRGETALFEQPFSEEANGWKDWKLSLERLAGRRGRLRAEVLSGGKGASAALFWSNPVLGRSTTARRRPNVILVSVDTLGSRHLSAYGARTHGDEFFSQMAKRGVLFENAISNSSLTNISHGAMLTGRFPLDAAPFWLENSSRQELSIAEILRRNGYATAAFTGGVLVSENLRFDHGFERFYQEDTLYKSLTERSDITQVLARAKDWLDGTAMEPFFLFLHTYEVHGPYYAAHVDKLPAYLGGTPWCFSLVHMRGMNPVTPATAGRYVRTLTGDGPEVSLKGKTLEKEDLIEVRDAYQDEIALVARKLAELFRYLQSKGALDNAVVILTADHGEAFFEHGLFEHGLLYDENLRVPLIIVAPGRLPAERRVQRYVSLVDLAPTILELAGVKSPARFDGRSLVAAAKGHGDSDPPAFYSFVAGNGFVWQSPGGETLLWRAALLQQDFGRNELFNRERDPDERRNLLPEPDAIPQQLRPLVRDTLARAPGIHISLQSYAHGRYRLDLAGSESNPELLFGFDMKSGGFSKSDGVWSGEVELGDHPYLVILSGRNADERGSMLDLTLSDKSGAPLGRYLVKVTDLGDRPSPVRAPGTSRTLQSWRVRAPAASGAGPWHLAPEEEAHLRALGYLR